MARLPVAGLRRDPLRREGAAEGIVDTSALVAVLLAEPEAPAIASAMGAAPVCRISAGTLGDCFAYALARDPREPFLFQGRDFSLTDIELVTEPVRERRLSEILATYGGAAPAAGG